MDEVVDQIRRRTARLTDALSTCDLDGPSTLPGWPRQTIACHLRYGAEALLRMTIDTIAGHPTAYYPEGREAQRPGTLLPRGDEDVVTSLQDASAALDASWSDVVDWSMPVMEPEGVFDTLSRMAVLRLTEIEVHGTDLDLGLERWSEVLVRHALHRRLLRLQQRAPLATSSAASS